MYQRLTSAYGLKHQALSDGTMSGCYHSISAFTFTLQLTTTAIADQRLEPGIRTKVDTPMAFAWEPDVCSQLAR